MTFFFHSALTESVNACTSRAEEVAPAILERNDRCHMRIHLSSEEVLATKASCLMSSRSGNVGSNDIQVSVLSGTCADGSYVAHLSSLAMPGSGLLHLDENAAMAIPGCCSLPTQPMNTTLPAAQPTYPNPPSFSFPDPGSDRLDASVRVYDSDQSLCEPLTAFCQ